jgi:Ca2+-binding RTX toxin-like protein
VAALLLLTLAGSAQAATVGGTGRSETLRGGTAADRVLGGGGNDRLFGGADDDRIFGRFGNDVMDGGTGDDEIEGGRGTDRLLGGAGNDKLNGGLGNDLLNGGRGKDVFIFNTKLNKTGNVDKITSFSVKDDTIWLDNAIFKKLGSGSELKPGKLNKNFLTFGSKAKDKNDYIVYDKAKGVLYYDADGSGKGAAVKFAQLKKGLAIDHKDFFVI